MQAKVKKAILQEPHKFKIRTRGFINLIGIKRVPFRIYPLYYGTMIKISGAMQKLQTSSKEALKETMFKTSYEMIGQNAYLVSLMIAYAILNSRIKIKLFARPLAQWLKWHFTSEDGAKLMVMVLEKTNIEDFLDTIISLKGLNVLAPKKEMSQNITEETIAPGESSEIV
jgi:hypothetical protein